MALDSALFKILHGLAGSSVLLDLVAIFLAQYLGYFMILGAVAVIFLLPENKKHSLYYSAFVALSVIISWGLIREIIGFVYARSRPFVVLGFDPLISHDPTFAFPSGHASFYFALAISIFFIDKNHRRRWYFLGAAALMGIARIFIGVHWPTDILAGALIGLLSVILVKWLLPLESVRKEGAL